jgi:hypothetical protein
MLTIGHGRRSADFSKWPRLSAGFGAKTALTSGLLKAYYIEPSMRPTRLRVVALLATLAMLVPEVTFARVHYFCRMMDRVLESACCCGSSDSPTVEGQPEARRPDCCARVSPPARSVAPAAQDTTIPVPPAALAATVADTVHLTAPPRAATMTPKLARGPPPVGPPLFVAHCSYLI